MRSFNYDEMCSEVIRQVEQDGAFTDSHESAIEFIARLFAMEFGTVYDGIIENLDEGYF